MKGGVMAEKIYDIRRVYPLEGMVLGVMFENGVFKKYDVSRLIPEIPEFEQLKDRRLFCKAEVACGGAFVRWNSRLDLSEYELYQNGTEWEDAPEDDYLVSEIVARFRQLRHEQGMTQHELSEKTGIRQSNIARMENGGRVPNIATLIKLGRALGYNLHWGKKA